MTPASPREFLANAIAGYAGAGSLAHLAVAAGVTARQFGSAQTAQPVATIPYLRLCAAMRLDPLPSLRHPMIEPSDFDFPFFAMGLFIAMGLKGHSQRDAAKAIGISASTVCRMLRGELAFIGVVLRTCTYIGAHPYGYCNKNNSLSKVSREKQVSAMA